MDWGPCGALADAAPSRLHAGQERVVIADDLPHPFGKFFICSSVSGHLGGFHVLAIVNSAAMNNGIHVSFSILVSSGYMPRSEIAGSYDGFIPSFL